MLVAVNLAVFVAMIFGGVSFFSPESLDLVEWGANFAPLSLSNEPWRLLTSAFVHVGIIHLAFNMWVLWVYGPVAEFILGRFAFFTLYFGTALASAAASAAWGPEKVSAGASGALFGIVGAMIGFFGRQTGQNPAVRAHVGSLMAFVGYNMIFGIMVPGIDNAAHLGGLFAGLLAGWIIRPRPNLLRTLKIRSPVPFYLVATAALLLLSGAAVFIGRARIDPVPAKLEVATWRLRAGDTDRALSIAREVAETNPENAKARAFLGMIELTRENWPEAEKNLSEAARLDPALPNVHRYLALALATQGKYAESLKPLEEALRREPDDKELKLMFETVRTHLEKTGETKEGGQK
jgi:membrane associated rhomboid family serine protease